MLIANKPCFRDHYIEIPYDLSRVLFIATANDLSQIPRPLHDRLEIIEIPSYTTEEKYHIAKDHLIKKQVRRHGLTMRQLKFADDAIYGIIEGYTRESGVRALERTIITICRKCARQIIAEEFKTTKVTADMLSNISARVDTRTMHLKMQRYRHCKRSCMDIGRRRNDVQIEVAVLRGNR